MRTKMYNIKYISMLFGLLIVFGREIPIVKQINHKDKNPHKKLI